MKRISFAMLVTAFIALIVSCTTTKRYITIQEPDVVMEYGIGKFEVYPNDILEIVKVKVCRGGSGICWKVKNIETGEYGYVSAEKMKARHKVYAEDN